MDIAIAIPTIMALVEIAKRVKQIPFVTKNNARYYILAGAVFLGIGSAILNHNISNVDLVSQDIATYSIALYGSYGLLKTIWRVASGLFKKLSSLI